ncbi:hypothetical protein BDD43_5044 [Mucilaginibacter gracilis]|uniref:DUF4097 domain-containing protein n=1 Tax=Mucilaginibacter gracilis TaxID=423350 RepID=A0A495J7S4_9SPHI|nr:DUF4097 family beta strand repeat-containing protein [Mucilaginibacter gracilis]RKR84791.1 hypothetical protein BDD43_5044 [Mucilaginibacter gracilis]
MKAIKYTGALIAAALLSARLMAQQPDQLVVPLSDPGKPYKLSVDLVFGSIKVSTYEGKDVVIEVINESKKRDDDDDHDHERKGGMKRIAGGGGLDITAKERNNVVTINTDMPMKNINLNIKIPRGVSNLKLSTVNGRGIWVSNVSGDLEISNTNGSITLTDISGSVVANTVNGSIKVNFKAVDNKAPMAFSTLNGSVDVVFPANLKANVKLKSDQGNVYSDFDIAADRQIPKVSKSNSQGMYRLSVDETVYGKINGGGPEMLMKTMNGNIYLRKAK